jgi:hypothetical protein
VLLCSVGLWTCKLRVVSAVAGSSLGRIVSGFRIISEKLIVGNSGIWIAVKHNKLLITSVNMHIYRCIKPCILVLGVGP